MIRQSVIRRNFRSGSPYVRALPITTGPLSRPSVSGSRYGDTYNVARLIHQMEMRRIEQAFGLVFAMKLDVHGSRLSTIIPAPG